MRRKRHSPGACRGIPYRKGAGCLNKRRREQLRGISERLSSCREELDDIKSDKQDAYDNLPDGIQDSERGEKIENAVPCLESAEDSINDAIEQIDEASE